MKVLLFVQTGDARPKCVSRSVGHDPAERLQGHRWLADSGFYLWWTAHEKAVAAARWWFVECENAAHGRVLISEWRARRELGVSQSPGILASGGKQEVKP